ncbi:MAG: potassium channel family protein [Bacilli bacterium]|nr:potassium channel family protein [Bacilli bacterium]
MKDTRKKKQPKDRAKVLYYLDAGFAMLSVFLGFSLIFAHTNGLATFAVSVAALFNFSLVSIDEFIHFILKRDKYTLTHNLFFSILYLLLSLLVLLLSDENNYQILLIIFYSIYLTARLGKLIWKKLESKAKKVTLSVVIYSLTIIISIAYMVVVYVNGDLNALITFVGTAIIIEGGTVMIWSAFRSFNARVVLKVLIRTHVGEVLFFLILFMVGCSIVLPFIEPKITNFSDALWYCFSVITTIGFGDFSATTFLGRLMTVILGLYGIIVTALITSVIVNVYNESKSDTSNKKEREAEEKAATLIDGERKEDAKEAIEETKPDENNEQE